MRHLLTLTCLLFVTAVVAEEGDFDFSSLGAKKALRDYKKAVAKDEKATELKQKELEKEAANLAKKTRDAFVESLKKALKKSMQAGNLEEANKINAAIKALEQGASPAGASVAGSKGKKKSASNKVRTPLIVGVWKQGDASETVFIVRPDKTAYHSVARIEGRWQAANKSGRDFIIHWSNEIIENIKINRDDRTFNAYSPSHGWRFQMARDPYPLR